MNFCRAVGDAARLGHRDEELKVDQIETHPHPLTLMVRRRDSAVSNHEARIAPAAILRDARPARSSRMRTVRTDKPSARAEGYLRNLQIVPVVWIGQCRPMFDSFLILIASAFLLAGFIKGVLGLGLPTVSMGLLAVTMAPSQAIAIVIVPAIVTNIWQTFGGPYLRDIMRRLWPLMVGTAVGIWLNAGR